MSSKKIIALILAALSLLALAACGGKQDRPPQWEFPIPEPDYNAKLSLDFSPFEEAMATLTDARRAELDQFLATATIPEIQEKFQNGELSSEELTIYYLDRIKRYDVDNFNSVLALNPQALDDARARDAERANGQAGEMMHGIPVLLKNNIAIKGMTTAAGAVAMQDWKPDRDAAVTAALRDHGAIILGHTNLSEWANWMDLGMPNGFSALGGQTRNPYGPIDTLGSSSGSAVAAAANFAVVTVGSETQGSLLRPANNNQAVALKPTHELVSGDYIIPLMPFQDNAGPMARNVTDAVILLSAMASSATTPPPTDVPADLYEAARDRVKEGNLRLGMTAPNEALQTALEELRIEVVMIDTGDVPKSPPSASELLPPIFKAAVNDFLPAVNAPVKSLEEIIAFNKEDMKNRAPYGQGHLLESQASDWSQEKIDKAIQQRIKETDAKLTEIFDKYDVDVVLDTTNYIGAPMMQYYDAAGWPAMVLPIGFNDKGEPISLGFLARPYHEVDMLAAAALIESHIPTYSPPDLNATIQMLDEKLGDKK